MTLDICPEDGSPLIAVPQDNLVGQTVDRRYKVLAEIGKGGMGIIYKAEHQFLQREVALKIVRAEIVQDETSVKRFLNEARAIAALKNPHTVTIYDSGVTEDGMLYYTMELLTGHALSALLRKRKCLAYPRAAELICQVCESLEEAHTKHILHRDIKPDNIFLTIEDGREFAKLVDFGIAKLLDDAGEGLTQTGMLCGTPRYLSPEQISGEKAGPTTDLYALGIVLYEMLAGRPPFDGPTPAHLMTAHVTEKPPPLIEIKPDIDIPPLLDGVLHRVLEKDPKKRYQSAALLRAALIESVGGAFESTAELDLESFDDIAAESETACDVARGEIGVGPAGAGEDLTMEAEAGQIAGTAALLATAGTAAMERPAAPPPPPPPAPAAEAMAETGVMEFESAAVTVPAQELEKRRSRLVPGLIAVAVIAVAAGVAVFVGVGGSPGKDDVEKSQKQAVPVAAPEETPAAPAQQPPQALVPAQPAQSVADPPVVPATAKVVDVVVQPAPPVDIKAQPETAVSDVQSAEAKVQPAAAGGAQAVQEVPGIKTDSDGKERKKREERPRTTKRKKIQKKKKQKKKKQEKKEDWFDGVEKLPQP